MTIRFSVWLFCSSTALGACLDGEAEPRIAEFAEARSSLTHPPRRSGTWEMAGRDVMASHFNRDERAIGVDNAETLRPRWIFDQFEGEELGALHATPVVTERAIYVGSSTGRFFALSPDGRLLWDYVTLPPNELLRTLATPAPVGGQIPVLYGTPIVGGAVYSRTESLVIFGDLDGNLYALDAVTGDEVWVVLQVDAHPLGGVMGNSLLLAGDDVVVGFAAIEDVGLVLAELGIPYPCCSHTGLVASFRVRDGKLRWRYDTIAPDDVQPLPSERAPFSLGPSGADVWAQPTYDVETQTIFVGTGQNYSPSATGAGTGTSDAIIALHAQTGKPKWIRQVTAGDIWVIGIPSPDENGKWTDQDFGDSPKIYHLPNGRKVVGAAQKSGAYSVIDAVTGELLTTTQIVQQANQLGGLQTGSAYGYGKVFVHGLNGVDPTTSDGAYVGVVKALSPDGANTIWSFEHPGSALAAPLALANGVLYLVAPVSESNPGSEPQQFSLLGLNARTGSLVASLVFEGRAVSGPVVANGRVYIASGNRAVESLGANDHGAVMALELPSAR